MRSAATHDVTRWLQAWARGDESALEKLVPLMYGELHAFPWLRKARRRSHPRALRRGAPGGGMGEVYRARGA